MKYRVTWRRVVSMLLCGVMLAGGVTGCGKKEASLSEEKIINYDMPAEGEKIVELNIKDYGTVKIRLFAEECPKAVENFLDWLDRFSGSNDVKFTVTISADEDLATEGLRQYT